MRHKDNNLNRLATTARYAATLGLAHAVRANEVAKVRWSCNPVVGCTSIMTVQFGPHYGNEFYALDSAEQKAIFDAKHWLATRGSTVCHLDDSYRGYNLGCVYARELHYVEDIPAGYLDSNVGEQLRACDEAAFYANYPFGPED